MKRSYQRLVMVAALLLPLGFSACAKLITPNPETQLSELRSGNYRIDPRHTRVLFKIQHMNLSTFVGRFNRVEASLNFDPDNLQHSSLDARVASASVDVNDADFAELIRGSDWLQAERFPEIRFTSERVLSKGGQLLEVQGQLSLLGVTRPLVLEVIFHGGALNMLTSRYTLGFTARGRFRRSDFGLDRYIPAVGDQIELEIYGEFQRL